MRKNNNIFVEGRKEITRKDIVREYECVICEKRTHIIYDGNCYSCERIKRQEMKKNG